ncbi:DUF6650 family protein [Microbacterium sp. RG1]|uniref:DUF6650 family protein n=1 Tax=Microbacterium sp. RG1 TaxID=2489212 RepID=UPI0010CA4B16|nr:DUF6650 family protein [Microbacterium sp. RG1]QCQ15457.1 hypothetical protein EHF32_01190 [Microbacterium sp. RG1]
MKPAELAARLTSISTPIGGLSWTPPTVDRNVARRVLTVLEDRRVLFNDANWEMPDACVKSVVEIRQFLTGVLADGGIGQNLEEPIRVARGYCRTFLTTVDFSESDLPHGSGSRLLYRRPGYSNHDWHFAQALGELRAGVGLQAAIIAARYKLPIEDSLAAVLPEL